MEVSESITRKSASNLALAFVLLPREKRRHMAALYAFCREVDDIADDESRPVEERRARLDVWRNDVRTACLGETPKLPVMRELQPVIAHYRLPREHFEEIIDGVAMDLDVNRYETWEELDLYCYRVASAVGLLSIEVFQYRDPACRDYAVALGKALQLTNILRDVRVDADRGRIYLPQIAMKQCAVSEREILDGKYSARFVDLAREVAGRSRKHFDSARALLPACDRRSMIAAELMGSVYWRLLDKLEERRFQVLDPEPTRLSKAQKLFLIFRTWIRLMTGATVPNYGRGG